MDNKKAALVVSTLASFLAPFMSSSVTIALPSIGNDLSMDAIALNWVTTSFLVAAATFLLPFGRLADIRGRKRIFTYGVVLHTVASVFAASSVSGAMLITSRAFQGTGGAMIFGTGIAMLTSVYPASERGKVLGFNTAATYLGLSLGPVIGGVLTEQLGWRSIFALSILIGVLILVFVRELKTEWSEAEGEQYDGVGAALLCIALSLIMYGFSRLPSDAGMWMTIAGAASSIGFLVWEVKGVTSPLVDVNMFLRNTAFTLSNIAALINYSATFAVSFLLSLYLQYLKGLSPQAAGLVLIFQPAVMALSSPLAGRISDRVEPRIVASGGMAILVVSLVFFVFVDAATPMWQIACALVVLGLGFGLFSSPNTNAVMSSVERRLYGVAASTLGTMRLTGQMLSMGIVIVVFSLYIGRVSITPEFYGRFLSSMHYIFTIFSILCFAGMLASLARGKVR